MLANVSDFSQKSTLKLSILIPNGSHLDPPVWFYSCTIVDYFFLIRKSNLSWLSMTGKVSEYVYNANFSDSWCLLLLGIKVNKP